MPAAPVPEFEQTVYYPTNPPNMATPAVDIAGGDFDEDGDIDLLVRNFDSSFGGGFITLLTNNGNGSFSAPVIVGGQSANGGALAVADVNGDGHLDFVTALNNPADYSMPNIGQSAIKIFLGNGAGSFTFDSGYQNPGIGGALLLGDLNGDGGIDLITTKRQYSDPYTSQVLVSVRLGAAGGTFGAEIKQVVPEHTGVASGNFNGDSFLDLVLTTATGYSVLLGNGDGTFNTSSAVIGGGASKVVVGDFNGDGISDLAMGTGTSISILTGNGSGAFTMAQTLAAGGALWAIKAGDMNGDGTVDIVSVNLPANGSARTSLFINDGNATFQPRTPLFDSGIYDVELLDLNGGGALDIAALAPSQGGRTPGVIVALQPDHVIRPFTPDDFDGDGRSDILWRHNDGRSHIWEMNGTTQVGGGNTSAQLSSDWTIQGTGDFDGDGKTDLLWRSAAGESRVWTLDGTTVLSQAATNSQAPLGWKVQDVADFNGDGKADILWRHDNGATNIWLMDGATQTGGTNTNSQAGNNWKVLGAGDFNGDGKADILWRNNDGRTHIWFMDGDQSQPGSGDAIFTLDNSWKFEEIGDFNGDHKADILWRNDNGETRLSLMDGRSLIGGGNTVSQTSNVWHIEDVGDYNGDGKSDILWRHDDGATFMWLMDGIQDIGSGYTNSQTSLSWHIA